MNDNNDSFRINLVARPSLIGGMARLFDFGNSLQIYNNSPTGAEADARALHSDFCTVGNDINNSMQKHEQNK